MPPEATATATSPSPPARTSFTDLLARDPTVTMLGALIVLAVFGFSALAPSFLAGDTLRSIAFQMPELGILALAMMIPLMSGGLNLAIIATANLHRTMASVRGPDLYAPHAGTFRITSPALP